MTRRAFAKPRGYPGDAELLDLIYRDAPYCGDLSPIGAMLHAWWDQHPSLGSVRERRDLLAALIDGTASTTARPRILAVACGHLREAQRSAALQEGRIGELVALDQDRESIALVAREHRRHAVTPVVSSIRPLLATSPAYGMFDCIYAAGLYDYLIAPVASALTTALFKALNAGGSLLVANVAPSMVEIGYMEAMMDWHLLYRDEGAMHGLMDGIPAHAVADVSMWRGMHQNIVYLQIRKA